MAVYKVKDADENYVNIIVADPAFMEANFDYFELLDYTSDDGGVSERYAARAWRDQELIKTDSISSVADHPQRSAYLTYRTALRDWPSTSDFPATKPTLGS